MAAAVVEESRTAALRPAAAGKTSSRYGLLKVLVLILVAMWVGSWLSAGSRRSGVTLPAYIGAMLVAAVIRNLDDATKLDRLSQRTIDDLGAAALSLFLVLALMTLKLWDLVGVAVPLADHARAAICSSHRHRREAPSFRAHGHATTKRPS